MVKNIKLAKASVVVNNMIDYTMNQYMFVSNTDKMEIPSNYHKLIQMCRFFYRVDPIAGCYDDDTEVLTKGGWKHFKDITIDDYIMTLDEKESIVYQKPTNLVNEQYDGKMIKFYNKKGGIDLIVTPNHNMFVAMRESKKRRKDWTFELLSAESVYGKYIKFKKNAKWMGKEQEYFEYKSIRIKMDDWLKFFGLWLAEGCVSTQFGQHSITIRHTNIDNINELRSLLISWWLTPHNLADNTLLQFSNRHLHEYLKQMTGALCKYVPEEYKNLSSRQIKILLDYYLRGDGSIRHNRIVAYTSSEKLRDDLMELSLKAGYNGSNYYLSNKKGDSSYFKKEDRFITANHDGYRVSFLKKTSGVMLKKKDMSIVNYGGGIHCVEVPNHVMYVRRNGKAVWCGNTVMNKMVDCAISDIRNQQSQCSDEEFEVYNSIVDGIEEFFRNACLEYLLSGLVLPEYEWDRVRGSDLSGKLDSRRRLWVPVRMWFRDPNSITIKLSPVPNRRYYYVTISNDLVSFILSGGRLSDGTADKETYDELVKNYPEFVDRVRKTRGGVIDIRLDNVKPILGKCLIESAYPTPYMTNALEALMHKRNLRKMDYSIASRTIAAIQLIKLGSDTFPCTDESDFTDIKNQMSYRTSEGNYERMFQLFGNHTLNITWVYPDTQAMLNQEKYTAVNDDIIAGFGFPRTLITGETIRSNVTGGSDLATFSPIATMEGIRNKFIAWLVDLYKEIKEKNNFTGSPIPTFSAMRLYRLMDIATIGMQMYTEGSLSRTTRLESMGLSFDAEMENKKHEKEKMVEYGIDGSPPMPYSRNVGNIPTKTKPETLSKRPNREKSVAND